MSSAADGSELPFQIILVMGVTGVGKSTFIKHATGLDVEVGQGLSSCECFLECQRIRQILIR